MPVDAVVGPVGKRGRFFFRGSTPSQLIHCVGGGGLLLLPLLLLLLLLLRCAVAPTDGLQPDAAPPERAVVVPKEMDEATFAERMEELRGGEEEVGFTGAKLSREQLKAALEAAAKSSVTDLYLDECGITDDEVPLLSEFLAKSETVCVCLASVHG